MLWSLKINSPKWSNTLKVVRNTKTCISNFWWGRMDGKQGTMWINKLLTYRTPLRPLNKMLKIYENVKVWNYRNVYMGDNVRISIKCITFHRVPIVGLLKYS